MIQNSLTLLRNELQAFINTHDPTASIIIDNIGMLGTELNDSLSNNIVITLIKSEDKIASSFLFRLKRLLGFGSVSSNPPNLLDLYVLFSCNYTGTSYPIALRRLDLIIQFFQGKTVFTGLPSDNTDVPKQFKMGFCNLRLKDIKHLWGSLGGRQVPFVLYKLCFV